MRKLKYEHICSFNFNGFCTYNRRLLFARYIGKYETKELVARETEAWECAKAYGIEMICRVLSIELPKDDVLCEQVKLEHKIKHLYAD